VAAVSDFNGRRKGSDDGQVVDKWTFSTNSTMMFFFHCLSLEERIHPSDETDNLSTSPW